MTRHGNRLEYAMRLERLFQSEHDRLTKREPWGEFGRAYDSFFKAAARELHFDPRFNAIHWAIDIASVGNEIAYAYCWMNACATAYKQDHPPGSLPADVSPRLSFFADTCFTRLHSGRDKLALMVWSYFCPFNPERKEGVLDYRGVVSRLRYPAKYAAAISGHEPLLAHLETLKNRDFKRVEHYRHLKVHRREPRIEIHGVKPFHDWSYMIPLFNEQEIEKWESEARKNHPTVPEWVDVREQCTVDGVLYDHRRLEDRLWDFAEVERLLKRCSERFAVASAECFRILRRRAPFRRTPPGKEWPV